MGMLDDSDPASVRLDVADLPADDLDAPPGETVEGTGYRTGCPFSGHQPQQRWGEQVIPFPVDDEHPVLSRQVPA
jgi:hypothetical protein